MDRLLLRATGIETDTCLEALEGYLDGEEFPAKVWGKMEAQESGFGG